MILSITTEVVLIIQSLISIPRLEDSTIGK